MAKLKYPVLSDDAQKIPLAVKPGTGKLIFYKDVVEGNEDLPSIQELNEKEQKKLTIARIKAQPGLMTADLNGSVMDEKTIISEIKKDTDTGKFTVQKEMMYLEEFLKSFKK